MLQWSVIDERFPSGPWVGFYTYSGHEGRHRMDLGLEFTSGIITGEGNDDVGSFVIRGRFDSVSMELHWTKTYVGMHEVFYKGFREEKIIWGVWEVGETTGGFKIWPLTSGEGEEDAETMEVERPLDAVGEVVAGWSDGHIPCSVVRTSAGQLFGGVSEVSTTRTTSCPQTAHRPLRIKSPRRSFLV